MKCVECRKIAKCRAVPMRGEGDKVTLVYFCAPCKREWDRDQREGDDA